MALQDATGDEPETVAPEVAKKLAVMEVQLESLQAMVNELRQSRDQWQQQAERATLALAGPTRPWWKRLAG